MKMISLSAWHAARCMLCIVLCLALLCEAQQKFCGKTLTDAMDLLCVNGYNDKLSMGLQKREVNDYKTEYEQLQPTSLLELPSPLLYPNAAVRYSELSPFWVSVYENLLAKTRRRREGGVYDECCRKSCSYSELAAYCRAP